MYPAGAPRGDAHVPVDTDKIVGGSKLLGEIRDLIRRKHYSIRTEQAYLGWAKRYILFHGKRHPKEMGAAEIVAFLSHLATTMIYTHVVNKGPLGVKSPLSALTGLSSLETDRS